MHCVAWDSGLAGNSGRRGGVGDGDTDRGPFSPGANPTEFGGIRRTSMGDSESVDEVNLKNELIRVRRILIGQALRTRRSM